MTSNDLITYLLCGILVSTLFHPFIKYFLTRPKPLVTLSILPEEVLDDLDSRVDRFTNSTIQTKLMYNIIRSSGNSTRPNLANGVLLREDFLVENVAETTALIMSSMSPQYKELISTALPEEQIEGYVLERVYLKIYNFSRDYNFEVLGVNRRSIEIATKDRREEEN